MTNNFTSSYGSGKSIKDCSARRFCVRVFNSKNKDFSFALFTFSVPIYVHEVKRSVAVRKWVDGRKISEIYPWYEQPFSIPPVK